MKSEWLIEDAQQKCNSNIHAISIKNIKYKIEK